MRRCGVWLLGWWAIGAVWAQATVAEAPDAGGRSEPAGPGLRWRLPPVIWSGSLAYDLRVDRAGTEPNSTQHYLTATLNGMTYIYQPWLALLNGTLNVTRSHGSGGADGAVDDSRFVTGGLRLSVFPRSRFPLDVRYEVTDSRTESSLAGAVPYQSRSFGITQQYRPPANEFRLSASYERRSQEGSSFGTDTQESLMADFATSWKRHMLQVNATRSLNQRQLTDESVDLRTVVARHSLISGGELSLETSANWAQTDDRLLIGANSTEIVQWSSIGLWRPEGTGLTVSGSARGFHFDSEQLGQSDTTNASLGANYELTRNLRLSGNASVTRTNGATATVWNGALTGTYQGDVIKVGEATYNWSGGVAFSQARIEGLEDNTASGQLGHSLTRIWPLDSRSSLTGSLGQSLSAAYSFGDAQVPGRLEQGLSRALTHTAGLTWYSNQEDRSAYARLSASDARQLDGERSRYQLLNLQVSGTYEIDRYRSWSGDLTVQRVFLNSLVLPTTLGPPNPFGFERQITHSASGEVTWRQLRVFGVPRLRFQSRLRLSQDARSQANALTSIPDREDASWENRLDYQVGRLDTTGLVRLSRTDGLWRGLAHLRVQRNF